MSIAAKNRRSEHGFPEALRTAARPRWSHRDPVEAGNPFAPVDVRHEYWNAATTHARAELVRMDAELDRVERAGTDSAPYATRVVTLAGLRFDVWAHRVLSVVTNDPSRHDYERWLDRYTTNWVAYVADTCPKLDVRSELSELLSERARCWAERARSGRAWPRAANHGR